MPSIVRLTLFKISTEEKIKEAVEAYSSLARDAKKDGAPYIVSVTANATHNDHRSNGFNFAANTVFKSLGDMKYYDDECEAHASIKGALKGHVAGPPLVVYMDANPVNPELLNLN